MYLLHFSAAQLRSDIPGSSLAEPAGRILLG